jgi:hypothetical protein
VANRVQVLVATIFAAWLIASVIVYLPGVGKAIRRRDQFLLIPNWQFFAPTPARHDVHILYQDKYGDDTLTRWTEVVLPGQRSSFNLVWNPDKRARKALFDIEQQLIEHINAGDRGLEVSVPYLTLLNYISRLPRTTSPPFTRFTLMRARSYIPADDGQFLHVSRFHRL